MKKLYTFLFTLCFISFLQAQSIQEVCASSMTNGTVVNCEYFKDTLYATGFFNIICGQSVDYIARWENDEWVPADISITDPGHALKVINDKMYIARYEESIDSNWVYVYEDGALQKVGPGVYLTTASGFSNLPNIYDIIEYDGKIVACGEFNRVGTESIQGIMQWDGTTWEAMGSGLSGNIQNTAPVMFPHQLMVHNNELYVSGNFRTAGGVEVNGISKWDGTEWTSMGAGFNNTVYSMIVYNNEIIVGGSFTQSGSTALNRIAKWDGTEWVPLDFGFTPTSSNDFIFVHTLKIIDDVLYIGGGLKEITYTDNTTEVCNGIVSLFNNELNTFMGGVPNNDIEAVCKLDNDQLLFGGGVFGSGYTGVTDMTINTFEQIPASEVTISPNPFKESIAIETEFPFETYEVINQLGQVVQRGPFALNIHLKVPAGIYFLKLEDEQGIQSVQKVMKK